MSGLALISGAVVSMALLLSANLWSDLWGTPEAVNPTRIIALFVLAAPQSVVMQGVARRRGSYKLLAISTVTANVVGMGVGVACALQFRSASALVVSPILSQVLVPILIQIGLRRFYYPAFDKEISKTITPFVGKVLVFGLLAYAGRNVPRIAVSRFLGSSVYGNWNRSDVLTSMPLQTVETAIVQVVYPEFRHDILDRKRAHDNWANMMLLVAWIGVPTSVGLGVVAPHLIPILFGPGWQIAAIIAPGLALASGLQMPGSVLSSGLQATNNQTQTWISEGLVLVIQVWCVVPLIIYGNIWFAIGGVIAAPVIRHTSDLYYANRHGLVNLRLLLPGYANVIVSSTALGAGLYFLLDFAFDGDRPLVPRFALTLMAALVALTLVFVFRRRLPPVKIAKQYIGRS
ncbi:hypothetical protein GCM10007304_39570 [Rhodococcoides trifolii]|uniref:Polysaccharide biosynthesis protein n=2 Tax=Rhodococcoides trifolii TaxID=908250 RepID=A0A917G4S1_9NOCA|nr:hypothetical protein GCM10007304_39570 [Rhodococcus trifolii]